MSRIGIGHRSLRSRKENRNSYEVGDLAEWLFCDEFGSLVLALRKIDGDELEGDLLLLEDGRNTLGAGGLRVAVEGQDHFGCCFLGDVKRRE